MTLSIKEELMNNPMTIRIKKRMSRAQMAEHMGVTQKTIRNWENGKTAPTKADIAFMKTAKTIRLK